MTRRTTIYWLMAGAFIVVGFVLAVMGIQSARERMNREYCGKELRAIGLCIMMYTNENRGGELPSDLGTLALDDGITPEVFVCPDSGTTVPSVVPADQLVAWVNAHSDFIYVGAGMSNRSVPTINSPKPEQLVWAYEKEENHHGRGMHVLFADAHVEWMTIDAARGAIAITQAARATTRPAQETP